MGNITEFPYGISSFGIPVLSGFGSEDILTGDAFFVNSEGDAAVDSASHPDQGKSPGMPFATIDYAIGRCTANNGDVVYVMPGHDETPTASINCDVAGVWVRGLGWGNDRPTIRIGLTAATFAMSAESTRLSNVIFSLVDAAVTITFGIDISASGCIVENCEMKPHATSQFAVFLRADGGSADIEDVIIRNNRFIGLNAASGTAGMYLDRVNQIQVVGNFVSGYFEQEHALDNTSPSSAVELLRAYIVSNIFENFATSSGMAVELDTNATGVLAHNLVGTGLDFEAGFTQGSMLCWENYMQDTDDTSGGIIPGALSTS